MTKRSTRLNKNKKRVASKAKGVIKPKSVLPVDENGNVIKRPRGRPPLTEEQKLERKLNAKPRKRSTKPSKKALTIQKLRNLVTKLTLREALSTSVSLKGVPEFIEKAVDPIAAGFTPEDVKVAVNTGKDIQYMIKKGCRSICYISFFDIFVPSNVLKSFYHENSLIGEGRKRAIKEKLGPSARQKRILTNQAANPRKMRKDADFYPTPGETTQAVLDFLSLPRSTIIYEPACGKGHISQTFQMNGYRIVSSDLYDRGYGEPGIDFLYSRFNEYDWLITNPPFSLADKFIEKAHANGKPFAMLLKASYFHAKRRRGLFFKTRPTHVLPLTWRPDFSFKKGASSTMDCCWFVWSYESFNPDITQPLVVDYYPMAKPTNYPIFNINGVLMEPYKPTL